MVGMFIGLVGGTTVLWLLTVVGHALHLGSRVVMRLLDSLEPCAVNLHSTDVDLHLKCSY